jgi:hypothetical protein
MKHLRHPAAHAAHALARPLAALALAGAGWLLSIAPARAQGDAKATPAASAAPSSASPSSSASAAAPPGSASASASASTAPEASSSAAVVVKPPPHATIGEPTLVRGAALPSAMPALLRAAQPAIDACYRDAIANEGDLEPTISLRLRVVPPGNVAAAMVNDSVEASSALRGCVRDAFAGLTVAKGLTVGFEALVPLAFTRSLDDGDIRPGSACNETCDGAVDDALQEAVRLRAQLASHCFRRAPSSGESKALGQGTLELSLRIASDGSVCGVSTMADPFARASLTSCLIEAMSAPFEVAPTTCVSVDVPFTLKGT